MTIFRSIADALSVDALVFASPVNAADGLIAVKSPRGVDESMNRLEALVRQRGLNVFARIDHAAGASRIGASLRPAQLLIFGNPQGGTPFMQCAQEVAGVDGVQRLAGQGPTQLRGLPTTLGVERNVGMALQPGLEVPVSLAVPDQQHARGLARRHGAWTRRRLSV